MKVRVHIMGPLRKYFTEDRLCLDIPEGATARDVIAILRRPPWLDRSPLLIVLNERFVEPSTFLKEGDQVTLMLPVGGG